MIIFGKFNWNFEHAFVWEILAHVCFVSFVSVIRRNRKRRLVTPIAYELLRWWSEKKRLHRLYRNCILALWDSLIISMIAISHLLALSPLVEVTLKYLDLIQNCFLSRRYNAHNFSRFQLYQKYDQYLYGLWTALRLAAPTKTLLLSSHHPHITQALSWYHEWVSPNVLVPPRRKRRNSRITDLVLWPGWSPSTKKPVSAIWASALRKQKVCKRILTL